ncbi:MAG: GNAT family N-acetyltransferase [Rikenellaceae bacterium]
MIEFRPIELSDRETIERYTHCSGIRNCDLSFANMYCWQTTFDSAWAIFEGYLIIRFRINGGEELGYMQPIRCDGSHNFARIIPELAKDAHSNGQRLRIIGLTEEGRMSLDAVHHNNFAFYSDRDYEDYIYLREKLEKITGKRYQPKRNHINQFEKLYNYEYHTLTPQHHEGCLALCQKWREERGEDISTPSPEVDAIGRALDNFDRLGLDGGVIVIDGAVVAFTYGSAINPTTFCTHIEKCDTSFVGIYSAINKLFAQSLPQQFTHINREEDMGIGGLRKSKLSYHPSELQVKYTAIYLHSHEAECKKLWKIVFGDEDRFIDHFIQKYFSLKGMVYVADPTNQYLSMVHIVDMECDEGHIAYIYGVATHPECRGKGYASMLMKAAMKKIEEEGFIAAILIPSEEWLIDYYAKFGFRKGPHLTFSTSDNFDFGSGDTSKDHSLICPLSDFEVGESLILAPSTNGE